MVAVCLMIAACAAPGPRGRVATLADRDADPARRVAAMRALGPIDTWPDPVAARGLLTDILWSDAEPDALRIAALDRLLRRDPADLRAALDGRLMGIDRWPVLEHVFAIAGREGWRGFTGLAVRSYARPSRRYDDLHRPERRVIERLNPDRRVEDVLLEMFIGLETAHGGAGRWDIAERVAAWTVLNRLAPPAAVRAMLASSPPTTALVTDLQAAAGVVDVLPPDAEAVRWLMALRATDGGAWWRSAAEAAASLGVAQRRGLELRHLAMLMRLPADMRAADRAELVQRASDRLEGVSHVARADRGVVAGAWSEAFADHESGLAWADLATIRTLLDAMEDRGVVTEWFVQADADLLDTRTEYGGVLRMDGHGGFATRPFAPLLRLHDRKFYSSDALIRAMYTGLAHYHFHAQRHDNAAFAGPGAGDLALADRLRPGALVLTFIDRNTLNVDYYQPGGVVADLGVVRR